ncbi:hypothetical protein MBLNU230_g1789t1 [Neophaeotheca triangularis]
MVTLLIMAAAAVVLAFNVLAASHVSLLEGILATLHVFAFVPIVVTLFVLARKQSMRTVFLDFTDNGGNWPSLSLSALVGQGSCMFVVLGSDGVAHLADGIEDAGSVVPKSMT